MRDRGEERETRGEPVNGRPPRGTTWEEIFAGSRVLPVLTVEDAETAVLLARALAEGGLAILEITLRTTAALEAVGRVAREVPEVAVGAGSVLDAESLFRAERAGATFVVSPGFTPDMARAARQARIPWLPGVATASEAMTASGAGFSVLKLFPAELVGGVAFLDAVRGPLPGIRFCPTGGIGEATYREYLSRPNVAAVGGSWMVSRVALESGDWPAITEKAREVAA